MTTYLLDANVLIALTMREHVHSARASRWFASVEGAALCPITEGALMRFAVRVGVPASSVKRLIGALRDDARITFWADDVSYEDVELGHVIGHRQVTDAYLASLARHHGGTLATMDEGLRKARPDAVFLIPE